MTQDEILSYVLDSDCYIYREKVKEDGVYYYVRRNGTKKMVVIYPVKDGVYTYPSICHICQTLDIAEIPEEAQAALDFVTHVKEKAEVLRQFPPQNRN